MTALFLSAAVPTLASAAAGPSGGAGLGGAALNAVDTASTSIGTPSPGNIAVTSTSGGITITTRASALLAKQLSFSGSVPAADAGKTVVIQRLGHETGWTWASTVTATVAHNGTFTTAWTTNHIGRFAIRALIEGAASAATAAPTVAVTVYRPSLATMYGPGFWGQRTACGKMLRRSTLGVANRTLRCGEKVALYYRGRTLIVPVIDRGPYANGADWDLTEATDKALGIPGTATVGAVSLPAPPAG
ncbi:MAG TPA: septal ring lytic transglycosylase RlpA family protein [Solirubrobacteraceae bacterium]|jgi:rare lipoprotein A (peptidoglycan hydrolase)|nr:septal ring lytic transglycosylase RlpA family protein [Solirubrobacteraceae bacterium]